MNREFSIENRNYILYEDSNNIRVFLSDKNNNPSIELALILYEDINNKGYIKYDMDSAFINSINFFNEKYPVHSVSNSEKIIITKEYNVYFFKKFNNVFNVYKVETKDLKNSKEDNRYNTLLNNLLLGQTINIGNYILSSQSFYKFLTGETNIKDVVDDGTKEVILSLIQLYKKVFENSIQTVSESGSGSEDAKIKVKRTGFANKIFMISLAAFSFGIIATFIFIMITQYLF